LKPAIALLATLVVGGASLGVAQYAGSRWIENELSTENIRWERRRLGLTQWTWHELSAPGLTIDKVDIELDWPIRLSLSAPNIDLKHFKKNAHSTGDSSVGSTITAHRAQPSKSTSENPGWRPKFRLSTHDMTLRWEDETLTQNMAGTLYPHLDISDGATAIIGDWGIQSKVRLAGEISGEFPHPHIHGQGKLRFSIGDTISFDLDFPDTALDHPTIRETPLPPTAMTAKGVWNQATGELAAEGALGGIAWSLLGTASPKAHTLQFRVPLTPLSQVVALFGSGIPEAKTAEIHGEVGLTLDVKGPPRTWTISPGAKDLAVSKALPANFGRGLIRWTSAADGRIHTTGPRVRGWASRSRSGKMPAAVIAAEDIRFRSHPGFDLLAIGEALGNAKSEERMRGGSTITQQLAKNLFLDGRRTLQRKLRELLLALSLESRMSKDAIITLYLNIIQFGPGITGINQAADSWFLKRPAQLSYREAAFLASILPAPNMWHRKISQTGRPPVARVNGVLDRMRRRGSLSAAEHAKAKAETLRIIPPKAR
jgi:hypothetical protein